MENNLSAALAKAQSTMETAPKNGYNPHFKSHFSTLEDLVEASRKSLSNNGLSICQYPESDSEFTYLVTKLKHVSGQEEVSKVRIHLKDSTDIQKFGSAMSYLKRYVYASICGIATSEGEDDGNGISQPVTSYQTEVKSDSISVKQAHWLRNQLSEQDGLEDKILKAYGISRLEEFPWRKMRELKEKLGIEDDK